MTFNEPQIIELRARFSKITSVDPCGEAYAGVRKLLNSLDQEDLARLAVADIKFLSKLAANRLTTHGALQ